jgi:CSLREA domain-containing protein
VQRQTIFLGAILATLAVGISSAHAATITVNSTADSITDSGHCTLREAITAANTDAAFGGCPAGSGADTIDLYSLPNPSTISVSLPGFEDANQGGDFDIYTDVTIQGDVRYESQDLVTTISGGGVDRVFHVFQQPGSPAPKVSLSHLTIRDGQAPTAAGQSPDGGGILVGPGAQLILGEVAVTHNRAGSQVGGNADGGNGGGIASAGQVALSDAEGGGVARIPVLTVTQNTAGTGGSASAVGGSGGGIYSTGTLAFGNMSLVADNHAGDGGANGAGGSGGGLYVTGAGFVDHAAIVRNAAGNGNGTGDGGNGGGIAFSGSLSSAADTWSNTIANNVAGNGGSAGDGGGGGGIFDDAHGVVNLNFITIAGNSAGSGGSSSGLGGGIRVVGAGSDKTTVRASILASNNAGGGGSNCSYTTVNAGTLTDNGSNLSFNGAGCPTGFGAGDPNLGPLRQDNGTSVPTMDIAAPSAAIDIVPAPCGGHIFTLDYSDARGAPKLPDAACDAGAVEALPVYSVSGANTGNGSGTLRAVPPYYALDCGAICNAEVPSGLDLILLETPGDDSYFDGWTAGPCAAQAHSGFCAFEVTADTNVSVEFSLVHTRIASAKIIGGEAVGKRGDGSARGQAIFELTTNVPNAQKPDFTCVLKRKHAKPKKADCSSKVHYKHLKPGEYKFTARTLVATSDETAATSTDRKPAKKKFEIG